VTLLQREDRARPNRPDFRGAARRHLLLAVPLLALQGLAGCSSRDPIRLGFLGGLSGRIADLGIGGRNGAQLAVDDLNADGGIGGRRVELLTRDDQQDAEVARRQTAELFDAGIACLIGPMTSQMALAILPLAEQRGIPVVSPLSGSNAFSGRRDVFFRVVSDAERSARQQGAALYRRGMRRLLPVTDVGNAAFTRGWNDALVAQFVAEGGTALPALEYVAGPEVRFVELAKQVAATDADGLTIAASAADCAVFLQQVRRLRPGMAAGLSVWAGTEELPSLGGAALDGVIVTQFFDRFSKAARWLDFVARYRQRFGDTPGYTALNGYDATMMAATALRSAGRDGLLASLREVRAVEGLQRRLTFDEFGDCLSSPFLAELRNGQYAAVPS
jgi:branched-chain amino acid transport system substrate-binding protein